MEHSDEARDADVVRRVLSGDREAYGLLVDAYAGALASLAFARTGDRDVARDLAQDALTEAYTRLGELYRPDRFGPWVGAICRHRALDWVRRRGVERDGLAGREAVREADQPAPPTPLQEAARQEELDRVFAALAELDADDREVLLLRHHGGLGRREAARLLGLRPATLDKRLQRALARLRQRLDADGAAT